MKSPNDNERLTAADPEFARLVSALRAQGPSADALAKTRRSMEAAAAVSVGPSAFSSQFKAASVKPWIGLGVGVLVLAVAGYKWNRDSTEPGSKTEPSMSAPSTIEDRGRESIVANESPPATVRVEDLPPVAAPAATPSAARAKTPRTEASAPAASSDVDSFREELVLVERMRTQLSRGETADCLRTIAEYGERFRGGAFAQEVEVMRVEALAKSGDGDSAREVGRRFLSQHPTSPYAGRVRSVLEKTK